MVSSLQTCRFEASIWFLLRVFVFEWKNWKQNHHHLTPPKWRPVTKLLALEDGKQLIQTWPWVFFLVVPQMLPFAISVDYLAIRVYHTDFHGTGIFYIHLPEFYQRNVGKHMPVPWIVWLWLKVAWWTRAHTGKHMFRQPELTVKFYMVFWHTMDPYQKRSKGNPSHGLKLFHFDTGLNIDCFSIRWYFFWDVSAETFEGLAEVSKKSLQTFFSVLLFEAHHSQNTLKHCWRFLFLLPPVCGKKNRNLKPSHFFTVRDWCCRFGTRNHGRLGWFPPKLGPSRNLQTSHCRQRPIPNQHRGGCGAELILLWARLLSIAPWHFCVSAHGFFCRGPVEQWSVCPRVFLGKIRCYI